MTDLPIDKEWQNHLSQELKKPYFKSLRSFFSKEIKTKTVYPSAVNIFNAFNTTPFEKIKVVILGQDPYHGEGQAHGLAFSVQDKVAFPPSLRNIFKEYSSDLGYNIPINGNLTKWAQEGVFLLNTVLTVREGEAHSHKNKGWEYFSDAVIKMISDEKENIVFVLWGKQRQYFLFHHLSFL